MRESDEASQLPPLIPRATPAPMVLYVVRDLVFVSKMREAAEGLGVALEGVRDVERLPGAARGARLVVLDLGLPQALRALELLAAHPETAAIPTIGFVGHERRDVMETARALGCGQVMAKGEFAARLSALLGEAR
jgi:CheY-like chemotaxis protein